MTKRSRVTWRLSSTCTSPEGDDLLCIPSLRICCSTAVMPSLVRPAILVFRRRRTRLALAPRADSTVNIWKMRYSIPVEEDGHRLSNFHARFQQGKTGTGGSISGIPSRPLETNSMFLSAIGSIPHIAYGSGITERPQTSSYGSKARQCTTTGRQRAFGLPGLLGLTMSHMKNRIPREQTLVYLFRLSACP